MILLLFSLDIEGAEFAVLKTIPWDKVDIQVENFSSQYTFKVTYELQKTLKTK